MNYRTRISFLLIIFILSILISISIASREYFVMACTLLFIVSVITTIRYTIASNRLVVKTMGITMADIDVMMIKSIKRSYNPISSPAGSLKRLKVEYSHNAKSKTVIISPAREEEFLSKLKEINPNIDIAIEQQQGIMAILNWDI